MVGVVGLSAYRAATQSLTTDEAFTWQLYLTKDLRAILTNFDANNHVLFTLLSWVSVNIFGDAEWAIRLPTVLASPVYVFAASRLANWNVFWAAALSLNPLILDFLSAGRGYGLAVAFLLLSLDLLLKRRFGVAGVAAGLALASNLSFALPIAGLTLVTAWQHRGELWRLVDRFVLPLVVTAFVFVGVPLAWMKAGAFYVGAESLAIGVRTLWVASFGRDWLWAPWAVAIVLGAAALRAGVFGALFWATVALHVAGHYAIGLRYPEYRVGLYLLPLATLVLMRASRQSVLVAIAFVGIYATQFRYDYYLEWQHDRNTRPILERLNREVREPGSRQVVVSWMLEPAVNYYRERLRLKWMNPVDRRPVDSDADLYLLLPDDAGVITKRALRVLWQDSLTGIRVAEPTRPPQPPKRAPA